MSYGPAARLEHLARATEIDGVTFATGGLT